MACWRFLRLLSTIRFETGPAPPAPRHAAAPAPPPPPHEPSTTRQHSGGWPALVQAWPSSWLNGPPVLLLEQAQAFPAAPNLAAEFLSV